MKRFWRKPNITDRARKCRARSPYQKRPFYVEWNSEFGCWAMYGRKHILVAVSEILSPKEQP